MACCPIMIGATRSITPSPSYSPPLHSPRESRRQSEWCISPTAPLELTLARWNELDGRECGSQPPLPSRIGWPHGYGYEGLFGGGTGWPNGLFLQEVLGAPSGHDYANVPRILNL